MFCAQEHKTYQHVSATLWKQNKKKNLQSTDMVKEGKEKRQILFYAEIHKTYQHKSNDILWIFIINRNPAMTHCHYSIQRFPGKQRERGKKSVAKSITQANVGHFVTVKDKPTN